MIQVVNDYAKAVTFPHHLHHGTWRDAFNEERMEFDTTTRFALPAWGWRAFVGI